MLRVLANQRQPRSIFVPIGVLLSMREGRYLARVVCGIKVSASDDLLLRCGFVYADPLALALLAFRRC